MRRIGVVLAAVAVVVGVAASATLGAARHPRAHAAPASIPDGVVVAGVHIGGLAPDAALQALRLAFETPVTVLLGTATLSATPAELGASADLKAAVTRARSVAPGTQVPLAVTVDPAPVSAYVATLAKRVDARPVDAAVALRSLRPVITASKPGAALDRAGAVLALTATLEKNRRGPVVLPVRSLQPKVASDRFGAVVVVRRDQNRLYLYAGAKLVRTLGVATGQAAYPTPLGRFEIVVKWKDPWWYPPNSPWAKGAKPIPPGPGNPLGTRWMGLSTPGVGIHGTPDSSSIGYSLSHGCVRMLIPDAEWLFDHVEVGTPVFIVTA